MRQYIRFILAPFIFCFLSAAYLTASPIDFSVWELQEPDNTTISSAQLLIGYSDSYFYVASDGGQALMDPQTGTPTSGSTHPRCELREMSGGVLAAWNPANYNTMTVEGAVNQLGGGTTGHVTLAQVFDGTGGFPLCEFEYSNSLGGFEILYEEAKGAGTYINLNTPISLNIAYTFILSLCNNVLTVTINGVQVYSNTIGAAVQSDQFYFKCGNYDQTATSGTLTTVPYTVVEDYSINVVHSLSPPPSLTPTSTALMSTATDTENATLTVTPSMIFTATNTITTISSSTPTYTASKTNTYAATFTVTLTQTVLITPTATPYFTETLTVIPYTGTATATNTQSATWTATSIFFSTKTATPSCTYTVTPQIAATLTFTATPQGPGELKVTLYPNPIIAGIDPLSLLIKSQMQPAKVELKIYSSAFRLVNDIFWDSSVITGDRTVTESADKFASLGGGTYYYKVFVTDVDNKKLTSKISPLIIIK